MKKTNLMKLIVLVVLVIMITIPTIVFAELKVPSRKGTVSGKGTEDKPYILQLGEPIIDIYYDEDDNDLKVWFQFSPGAMSKAANYIVEHNADMKRLRFKLQGSENRVAGQNGGRYL